MKDVLHRQSYLVVPEGVFWFESLGYLALTGRTICVDTTAQRGHITYGDPMARENFSTSVLLCSAILVGVLAIAQDPSQMIWSNMSVIPDEDGILSVQQKPFDRNGFVIARDMHVNKFNDQKRGLKNMSECFFNWGDCATSDKQDFELCEQLGLSVLVAPPEAKRGRHILPDEWMKMTDEEIDALVKRMVEQGGNSKAIVGYQIADEPSARAFPKLAVAVAAVRKYAPGKLTHINLYPNYATLWTMDQVKSQLGTKTYQEYLEQFVEIVKPDFICYDNYMVQFSMDQQNRKLMAKHYTNIMAVRDVAMKNNLPWWNVVSSNQIRQHTVIPTLDNMMLQAYTSLAAGAGGVRWYTYWQSGYDYAPINENEQRTNTWYALREVNRHLAILGPMIKTLKSMGVYFTDPAIDPSLPLLPGKIVQEAMCTEPLMIGEFESDRGNRYAMVVNISLEHSASFVLKTDIENERLFIVSTGEQFPYFREIVSAESRRAVQVNNVDQVARSKEKAYWLPAGQGVLIKCSGMVDEKGTVCDCKTP